MRPHGRRSPLPLGLPSRGSGEVRSQHGGGGAVAGAHRRLGRTLVRPTPVGTSSYAETCDGLRERRRVRGPHDDEHVRGRDALWARPLHARLERTSRGGDELRSVGMRSGLGGPSRPARSVDTPPRCAPTVPFARPSWDHLVNRGHRGASALHHEASAGGGVEASSRKGTTSRRTFPTGTHRRERTEAASFSGPRTEPLLS